MGYVLLEADRLDPFEPIAHRMLADAPFLCEASFALHAVASVRLAVEPVVEGFQFLVRGAEFPPPVMHNLEEMDPRVDRRLGDAVMNGEFLACQADV
ncbi:hypothetical protein [Exiguobacterium sp. s130]|uniref:hypothetical protein n=1 Tax=Exiguobacterium sp. s130 TaxID=2751190 RepID=UPI001BEAC505|nr:hypothetical protein [Exiguobacterium sp. s130]